MKVFAKIASVLFVLCAAFLVYSIVAAFSSAGGANVAVCVLYAAGALVLCFQAHSLWRRSARPAA